MRPFAVFACLTAVFASGLALEAAAEPRPVCGAPGKPACPLQGWMRTHAAGPLATKDFDALEQSLLRVAELNPDPAKWGNWTKIAKDGASAAKQRDARDVRASCGRCHRAYRRAYNARFRTRSVER